MRRTIKGAVALLGLGLCFTTANAQDYQISFDATGEASTIESVDVQNLTKGTSLTLGAGEILHLKALSTDINGIKDQSKELVIYPNPMIESSNIEFVAQQAGDCFITLSNIMSKQVLSGKYSLGAGSHVFNVSGLATGVYCLSINSESYYYTGKLVSKSNSSENGNISYVSTSTSIKAINSGLKSTTVATLVEMQFNDGDELVLKGKSGVYIDVIKTSPTATATESFNFADCTDPDGNTYNAVKIGEQVWMAENLQTTKYNDNTEIPLITESAEGEDGWANRTTPAYCWYDNDETTAVANGHGALYNWYTVDTDKLCPTGWHVPTDAEWTVLEDYITEQGHDGTEGTVLKATTGWNSDGNGTDNYGFSALPGGSRRTSNGAFDGAGYLGGWWSSTESGSLAYYRYLYYNAAGVYRSSNNKSYGFSVRCLRD